MEKRKKIDEMYGKYRKDFPSVKDISAEELAKRLDERAVSMIPGAISKAEFEAHRADFAGKPIVVHCTIGYRSGVYVEKLAAESVDALNLAGSILSWVHAGQPVVDAEGNETHRVHVYGAKWDLLPEGYQALWRSN
jgi:rhodanese-related sulfurtransferase